MSYILRPLSELCERSIVSTQPSKAPDNEFWYIDISAVDNAIKQITRPQRTIGKVASVRARQVVHHNDVIVSTTRPNLNAVAIVPRELHGNICSTGFCVLRCGAELEADYLFLYVQSGLFINALTRLVQGALYPAVTDKQVLSQAIPWLPLDQQRRVAFKLKTQFEEVETARKALASQRQEIINLGYAYIRASIEQSDTSEFRLGDVLDEVKKGIGENWADYPVLGATRDGLAPAREPPGKQPQRYKPVFAGTVFYNPMRILIGSIAYVDDNDQPGITSPDYVALQGKAGKVDSRWFYYWLRSPYGVQCINSLARGAVRERMLFNRLAEGAIRLPPYREQLRVSKALAQLQPLKAAVQRQLDDLNKIPERLLALAFNPGAKE
ncbi:restriction endonuclease subunit S [Candidatus Methylospira mobilis]|uniref:Restriction endonuclease subunit S n=1 Tax=Candidatus Methylospira mobilis TaxID=1808979 RepID=A0A5Q0BKT3_9GAMM|nr:restriction endonuclease subunit S [Candidatus Methylospira mobilis]